MALIPMEYEGGVETGTITKTRTSGTLVYDCWKKDDIAHVNAWLHTLTSDNVANGTFFTLPSGFRPNNAMKSYGYMDVVGVGRQAAFADIATNGNVNIAYSNNNTCSQVFFSATFRV